MLNGVIDALTDIDYTGPLLESEQLQKAIDGGPKSVVYTEIVHRLAEELRQLCSLEESVSQTNGPDDASSFVLELSSFLKELGCPYMNLITGHMSSRLQSQSDRLLLLDYLLSELMAARMVYIDKPQETAFMEVTIQETPTAKDLKDILMALKMTDPPAGVTAKLLFEKLKAKLRIVLQQEGPNYVGRPLYNQSLTEAQWKEVDVQHRTLLDDYKKRREMLITRLDCTIQSFEWSGRGVDKRDQIQTLYRPLRNAMKISSSVKVSDFLAARSGMLAMKKTSDAAVRVNTRSQVNKVVIGRVPDRGGRPSEQQPPPPEMPSWQQQRTQGGGGGGRGGGGGGRGGSGFGGGGGGQRVQGGWNSQDSRGGNSSRGGRGQGYQQENRGNPGYQQDTNRGNQGYQQDSNRGGHGYQQDTNRGNPGYSDNRNNQGYTDNRNNQGYNNDNRNNFRGNQNYQDTTTYQDNTNNRGYQNSSSNRGNYNQNQGYQSQQSGNYQSQQSGNYQSQQSGGNNYQNQGFQSKGRYQNEHDDRAGGYENRGGSGGGRGRSSYNRGGRN